MRRRHKKSKSKVVPSGSGLVGVEEETSTPLQLLSSTTKCNTDRLMVKDSLTQLNSHTDTQFDTR